METATLPDTQQIVSDMVRKVSSIATLPEITVQIIRTVEDPRSSASQLHKIVAHDPALVTRILKVVNSAFYGLPGQIGSIERAIVLLGLNAVKNIAVAASLGQLFRGVKLCEGFTARDLWRHCVAVGVTARQFARELKLPIADEAFLGGMIHDVGLLVSLQNSADNFRIACEQARTTPGNFCEIERSIMQVDHQMLGAGLAKHWKFPRSLQLVAGYHHDPIALADEHRLLVSLVHAADTLCAHQGHGFNLTALHQKTEDARLDELGIDPALVDRVAAAIPELVGSASSLL